MKKIRCHRLPSLRISFPKKRRINHNGFFSQSELFPKEPLAKPTNLIPWQHLNIVRNADHHHPCPLTKILQVLGKKEFYSYWRWILCLSPIITHDSWNDCHLSRTANIGACRNQRKNHTRYRYFMSSNIWIFCHTCMRNIIFSKISGMPTWGSSLRIYLLFSGL